MKVSEGLVLCSDWVRVKSSTLTLSWEPARCSRLLLFFFFFLSCSIFFSPFLCSLLLCLVFLSVTHTSRRDWGRRVTLYLFFQCLSSSFFFPFLFVLSFFFSVFGIASLRHSLLPRGHTCAEERHFDSCLFCSVPCRFSYFYFLFLLFLLHRRLLSKSLLLDLFSCLSLSLSLSLGMSEYTFLLREIVQEIFSQRNLSSLRGMSEGKADGVCVLLSWSLCECIHCVSTRCFTPLVLTFNLHTRIIRCRDVLGYLQTTAGVA